MSSHLFTYAIGDIYGDHGLLTTLLDRIHDHADGEDYRLVFLGNTIDRGPNANAVLSALRSMELRAPDRVVTLRGIHEAMMAGARGDPDAFAAWKSHGGDATLRSFGVRRHADLPREVVDWVARRPSEFRDGLRLFVSSAATAEAQQDPAAVGLHVVHGASVTDRAGQDGKPGERVGRTDLDTGAGFGGCLTAAIFSDLQASPAGFFQALADGSTRFLAPQRAMAQPWDPRLALKIVDHEPETAASWSLRQDADLVAARMAQTRRDSRRRTALVAAAGLVVVIGGAGILLRPAMTYVARSMAPVDAGQQTAGTAVTPREPTGTVAGETEARAAFPKKTEAASADAEAAPAAAPDAVAAASPAEAPADSSGAQAGAPAGGSVVATGPAETGLRTHALPGGEAEGGGAPAPPLDPAATAAFTPAPDRPAASQPAVRLDAPQAILTAPDDASSGPADQPTLPALAMAGGMVHAGAVADGGEPTLILPQSGAALAGASAFTLALEPSRRGGWNSGGTDASDPDLAGLGLTRESSLGQPVLGSGRLVDDGTASRAKPAATRAKPKQKPKPRIVTAPRPAGATPRGEAEATAQATGPGIQGSPAIQGGPIDLRALMDQPQRTPRKRVAPRAPGPIDPTPDEGGVAQP